VSHWEAHTSEEQASCDIENASRWKVEKCENGDDIKQIANADVGTSGRDGLFETAGLGNDNAGQGFQNLKQATTVSQLPDVMKHLSTISRPHQRTQS